MWSRNVLSAPAPMKYLTVSIEPLDAAKCKGVSSHVFGASSAKSCDAMSMAEACGAPLRAAVCNAVSPQGVRAGTAGA